MQNQVISIRYQVALSDYIQSNWILRKNTLAGRVEKIFAIIVLLYAFFSTYVEGIQWSIIPFYLLVLIFWFGLIQRLQIWIMAKRNPHLFIDIFEIVYDDDGVNTKSSSTEVRRDWSAYRSALESERYFFLLYGKGAFGSFIPKRAFSNEAQIIDFRDLIQNKIGNICSIK